VSGFARVVMGKSIAAPRKQRQGADPADVVGGGSVRYKPHGCPKWAGGTVSQVIAHVFGVVITPWKLVGYLGVALFTARWFVQLIASKRRGKPVLPRLFWYMSISGSLLLLSYFIFGKNDSVGILANLFPALTALYNLWLDMKHRATLQA
jgi:lipid-A-disaccharide synthase-like uncharacterized protein